MERNKEGKKRRKEKTKEGQKETSSLNTALCLGISSGNSHSTPSKISLQNVTR